MTKPELPEDLGELSSPDFDSPLFWFPRADVCALGRRRRSIARPAVNLAIDTADADQHFKERPLPHGAGKSIIRPSKMEIKESSKEHS